MSHRDLAIACTAYINGLGVNSGQLSKSDFKEANSMHCMQIRVRKVKHGKNNCIKLNTARSVC